MSHKTQQPTFNDALVTLDQIKAVILPYLLERGWDKLEPRDLATSIVIEATELLEHFQWGTPDIEDRRAHIRDELADTFTYLIEFAMRLDIDIAEAFHDKLERVKQKYPVSLFNPSNKEYNRGDYIRIKQLHRAHKNKS
ncbi:MAG TPA: nucleotide pyrophosphohydrolase [Candidatus Saccharimonadales bacterium]|nr:nucleotide pyrophosphohydrolase [Candidatus Saccharimonadales bacterium]